MEIKRGYVKWIDKDGVAHKELLVDHPELLKKASPREQLAAEEAKRMTLADDKDTKKNDELYLDTLADLKAAPVDVLTSAELVEEELATKKLQN